MPNHCASRLEVSGPNVSAFAEFATGFGPAWDGKAGESEEPLDLNQFVPIPAEVINASSEQNGHAMDAFNSGGYNWCVDNWGTKWGTYECVVSEEAERLIYEFQTAWSPFSDSVLLAMSSRFPDLRFELKYAEQGSGYVGLRIAQNGEMVDAQQEDAAPDLRRRVGALRKGSPVGLSDDEELRELLERSG